MRAIKLILLTAMATGVAILAGFTIVYHRKQASTGVAEEPPAQRFKVVQTYRMPEGAKPVRIHWKMKLGSGRDRIWDYLKGPKVVALRSEDEFRDFLESHEGVDYSAALLLKWNNINFNKQMAIVVCEEVNGSLYPGPFPSEIYETSESICLAGVKFGRQFTWIEPPEADPGMDLIGICVTSYHLQGVVVNRSDKPVRLVPIDMLPSTVVKTPWDPKKDPPLQER